MRNKIVRRIAMSILSLLVISALTFFLMELAPGTPVSRYADNPRISRADRERIEKNMGLDRPAHIRYFIWLRNAAQGDLGLSYMTGQPVSQEIMARLPATLRLMGASFLVALIIAVPLGIYSATRRHSIVDSVLTAGSYLGLSVPAFWFGLILIYIFAVWLRWLPAGGQMTPWFDPSVFPPFTRPFALLWEYIRHMIMPVFVLSLSLVAGWSRYIRSSMLDVINQNYIRTARAKGVPERKVLYRHALRNALTPLVTLMGMDLPAFFAGAVIVEQIFAWPGMGRLFLSAVTNNDYQVMMGITMITAILVLAGNLLADLFYTRLDPRVKYEG
ncbi:ABC transporter permease [Dethiobacter alkaliphilus]|uniref:Binding-protein-dependent transport systems inner membrane component n=1 Tax=Dethiobacter alkaliphilus AHT 1 TaxID=555088 RepID=C0GHX4_DETAL|nr:ABC transporter permease [Dethiobacter alkaliphilus]EEG77048.1 binding-protein-dependent transport systems inner membrane component [Dethiobacter alkaliphilus AHT 1]